MVNDRIIHKGMGYFFNIGITLKKIVYYRGKYYINHFFNFLFYMLFILSFIIEVMKFVHIYLNFRRG